MVDDQEKCGYIIIFSSGATKVLGEQTKISAILLLKETQKMDAGALLFKQDPAHGAVLVKIDEP